MPTHPAECQCDQAAARAAQERPRWGLRALGLAIAVPCAAVLAVAAAVHPDARGYDTHTQLGLPPCGLAQRTGMPCPTCGMTTAFSHMVRGQATSALRVQPFGAVLSVLTALAAAAGLWQAVRGRDVLGGLRPKAWWLWIMLAAAVGGWMIKVAVGVATGELPFH